MSDLCKTCIYSQWDSVVYHSAKECGMYGAMEQPIFIGCSKIEEVDAFTEMALDNCEEVTECDVYAEYGIDD